MMRKIIFLVTPAVALIVLTACVSSPPASLTTPEKQFQNELTQNLDLWKSKAIEDYSFTIRVTWFSPQIYPVVITVKDGVAVSHVSERENHGITTSMVMDLDTIEKLFESIRETLLEDPSSIEIRYDPVYGFPNHLMVDPIGSVFDEQWGFDIFGFSFLMPGTAGQ